MITLVLSVRAYSSCYSGQMIDSKNLLLIVGVLVFAGIVGLYIPYLQTKNVLQAPLPVATSTGALVVIEYTNNGFEPHTITVKASTTIEWVNISDKLMWVASNPHPSHTDLPGFDERGVEGNGEPASYQGSTLIQVAQAHTGVTEYRYTFTKVGRWGYHNHLSPQDRGVVIVQ